MQDKAENSDNEAGITSADVEDQLKAVHVDDGHYSAFRPGVKVLIVTLTALAGFMSPLAINIYVPALPTISQELHISDAETLISVTTYFVFQGIAPSFWAPLSDSIGRRPVYVSTFIVFLVSNLGLAYVNVYWGLLVLRMAQACGASSAIALSAGQVSDIARRKERGRYMGYVQMGTLVGPAVGPVFGGLLAQRWGWHAVFFFLSALTGAMLVCLLLLLPETLRRLVGDGSRQAVGIWRSALPIRLTRLPSRGEAPKTERMHLPEFQIRDLGLAQPWLNFARLDISVLILCYACPFVVFSVASSTLSTSLSRNYGYNAIEIGLCYLPLGAGFIIGSFAGGRMVDREYARAKRMHGDSVNLYLARLRLTPIYLTCFLLCMLVFEWFLDYTVHIAGPLVIVFFATVTSMMCFTCINTLLVDLNLSRAASVIASLNIGRCVLGAVMVAFTQFGIDAIGSGWMFTIYILVTFASCLPLLILLPRKATKWFAKYHPSSHAVPPA